LLVVAGKDLALGRTQLELITPAGQSAGPVEKVTVEAERRDGNRLWVRYLVEAPLDDILIPGPAAPERTDLLWHHTCCEAFIRTPGTDPYIEFNFSPSSRWAAYSFDAFREGMADWPLETVPEIALDLGERWFALEAEATIPDVFDDDWLLQISVIVEAKDGTKSFWALRHKPGEPDFHHSDCFAMLLPEDQR
jgi:hypothetical protein